MAATIVTVKTAIIIIPREISAFEVAVDSAVHIMSYRIRFMKKSVAVSPRLVTILNVVLPHRYMSWHYACTCCRGSLTHRQRRDLLAPKQRRSSYKNRRRDGWSSSKCSPRSSTWRRNADEPPEKGLHPSQRLSARITVMLTRSFSVPRMYERLSKCSNRPLGRPCAQGSMESHPQSLPQCESRPMCKIRRKLARKCRARGHAGEISR